MPGMNQTMHTQWHRAVEATAAGLIALRVADRAGLAFLDRLEYADRVFDAEKVGLTVGFFSRPEIPRYVFDEELIDMVRSRPEITKSVEALHEAGLARLPWPLMAVEWNDELLHYDGTRARCITFLSESGGKEFRAQTFSLGRDRGGKGECICISSAEITMRFVERDGSFGLDWSCYWSDMVRDCPETRAAMRSSMEAEARIAGTALYAAVLLLHTRGVSKEAIEPGEGLRKARERSGKPAIPRHTVIHIGHVHDRAGKAHAVDPDAPRRTMPVYFCPGHVRRQHFGPHVDGKVNPQTKPIYIEPHIVNYVPGGEEPEQMERGVRW